MRAFHRYFTNPFDARGISLGELRAFTTDHLSRMRASNPGGSLDERLAATQGAYDEMDAAATGDLIGGGARKARKLSKRQFRRDHLPGVVARIYAFMMAHFGPRAPEMKGLGARRVFQRCPDDLLGTHLRVLHEAVTAHQATVGDEPVALAAGLMVQWAEIHQRSESATGTKTRSESELRRTRRDLQWQLYLNLLRLVELHPRQPEKLNVYMQPHLLRNRRRAADPVD